MIVRIYTQIDGVKSANILMRSLWMELVYVKSRTISCATIAILVNTLRVNEKESRVFDTLLYLSVRIAEGQGQGESRHPDPTPRPDTPDPTPRPDTPTPRHAKGGGGDENRMRAECKGEEKP